MHRASMPSVQRSRLLAAGRVAVPSEDDIRLCYVLLASVMSLMLLCGVLSLLSHVRGDGAFPANIYVTLGPPAIMLALLFLAWIVAAGFRALAASSGPPREAPAPTPARLARRLCACGLSHAEGVAALPAFPFQPPAPAQQQQPAAATSEGERQPQPQPPRRSAVLCAVCLEDVRAGEMVRQLPACRHLFHVDCVDAWLRSHRTCPLCRCELPRRKATAQHHQTVAVTPAMPEAVPLPPV